MKIWIGTFLLVCGCLTFYLVIEADESRFWEGAPHEEVGNGGWPRTIHTGTNAKIQSQTVRAPGKIEGSNQTIELRPRITEQIVEIPVERGQWVSKGDVLIALDSFAIEEEFRLAKANYDLAVARKKELDEGARETEIEAARKEFESTLGPLWSAERALERGTRLFEGRAISEQMLEELQARVNQLHALSSAARLRLSTLELPPTAAASDAANANVRAAKARLQLAQIQLTRTKILAPSDGRILEVNVEIGELAGPDMTQPLITMADTSQLLAVAEVDEFDAFKVDVGQFCEITSDSADGILAEGVVVELEPQMQRKRVFGQWANERNDTFSRRAWIRLLDEADFPIGLPVEVTIKLNQHRRP